MATVADTEEGEVWLVRFDPSAAAEIRKVRSAVVVNLDAIGRGGGKGTSLISTCLTPEPPASSGYVHVPEGPSPHERSISVTSIFLSPERSISVMSRFPFPAEAQHAASAEIRLDRRKMDA